MAIVYLHIGAPKTATSTLQYVMAHNYRRLLKSGVLYPQDILQGNAHHALVCDLLERHRRQIMPDIWYGSVPRGQAWELLHSEIERHNGRIHSVVVSSELFFGQIFSLNAMLREVAERLQQHEIRVVVYLRRQDELYSSFYNQDVKGIRQWSQSAYQFYQTHQIFELGYHGVLKIWSDALGKQNMIVRPFEAAQWQDFDIINDFSHLIGGIPLKGVKAQNNDSLGMVQLYIKRCLNKVGFEKHNNEEVLKVLYALCPEAPLRGCQYIHKSLYKKYRAQWLEENREISDNFLEGRNLFDKLIPTEDQVTVYELNRFGVALFVRNVFNYFHQGKYKKYRQLFSKATLLVLAEQNLWNAIDSSSRIALLEWATAIDN